MRKRYSYFCVKRPILCPKLMFLSYYTCCLHCCFIAAVLFFLTILHAVKPYFSEGLKSEKYICPKFFSPHKIQPTLPIDQSNSLSKITTKYPNFDHSVPKFCPKLLYFQPKSKPTFPLFSYPTDKLCIMPNVAQVAKYCPNGAQILPKDFA